MRISIESKIDDEISRLAVTSIEAANLLQGYRRRLFIGGSDNYSDINNGIERLNPDIRLEIERRVSPVYKKDISRLFEEYDTAYKESMDLLVALRNRDFAWHETLACVEAFMQILDARWTGGVGKRKEKEKEKWSSVALSGKEIKNEKIY